MAETKPDYYSVLGISREATASEIKAAFQKLVSDFHTAGKPKNINAVEEIRQYVRAHHVLSDPQKRAYYNRTGFHPIETEMASGMQPIADTCGNVFWSDVDAVVDAADIILSFL